MQLIHTFNNILEQLTSVVHQLDEQDFSRPSPALSDCSFGQHLRHTLEFFVCLEQGFASGSVNYDRRAHDTLMETNKLVALKVIQRIREFVQNQRDDQLLTLEVSYDAPDGVFEKIETNYYRELIYNIEHAVHHMAIMKIGLREVAPYITIPPDFGVAVSTMRYRHALLLAR